MNESIGTYEGDRTGAIYFTHDENHIYAEIAFNAGSAVIDSYEKDECFSLDENLQAFIEEIEANNV